MATRHSRKQSEQDTMTRTRAADLARDRLHEHAHATRAQEGVHPASGMEEGEWVEGRMEPEPRPGYVQRWVRIDLRNQDDRANMLKRQREGWLPRPADTVPDSELVGFQVASRQGSNVIIDRDRILCEMPVERAKRRAEVIDLANRRLNEAIEQDIHKHIPERHLALNTRKSRIAVGNPRVPRVADDE